MHHFGGQYGACWGLAFDGRQGGTGRQTLTGLPLVEGVAVVCQQGEQLGLAVFNMQNHRGTEAAQQRGHWRVGNAVKDPLLFSLMQHAQLVVRQGLALFIEQADHDGNHKGRFAVLTWGGGAALAQGEGVALVRRVVHTAGMDLGRARLRVPVFESAQVLGQCRTRVGVCNGLCEVVTGDGLAIMALKIQGHATGKTSATQFVLGLREQGLHHAHHLGPFFVHGDGVEVVDFLVAVGAYRVGHGAGVFGKLHIAQQAHVFNALDRASRWRARQVLAELLVAKHGQALFE